MTTLVSVDLDPVSAYHAVHGLSPASPESRGVVMERCLERYLELFDELNATATFFVIGEELAWCSEHAPGVVDQLFDAQARGHRVGNHSWSHRYDLTRLSGDGQREELRRAHRFFSGCGLRVEGFRAPGYVHNPRLLRQVEAMGYRYDSSRMPAPLYYGAKAMRLIWMKMRGRNSVSQLRGTHAFWGDERPSILPQSSLWEVPISVTPWLRLPMHGALLLGAQGSFGRSVRRYAEEASYVHLHFHGLELASADDPGVDGRLRALQPELSISLAQRKSALRSLIRTRSGAVSIESVLPKHTIR